MDYTILFENTRQKPACGYKYYRHARYIIFFLLFIWCAGFLFPFVTPSFTGKSTIIQFLKFNYSIVCHQAESANIYFGNEHFLVCARCLGIYSGAFLISFVMLFNVMKLRLNLKFLLIFITPLIFDAIAVRLDVYAFSTAIAFVTGLFCGAILLIYIFDSIENSF